MVTIPTNIIAAAIAAMKQSRVPSSVSIAQWAIESGWGAHSPGNNPFGMKPRKGMNDPSQNLMTTEVIGGKSIKVSQPFRTFPSLDAAFVAHAQLLSTAPVYAPAMAILPIGKCPSEDLVTRFIYAMAPHYATDPLYASKLISTIKAHDLSQYDLA